MAVSVPVDIVMDVARAADPARFRSAVNALGSGELRSGEDYARVARDVAHAFAQSPADGAREGGTSASGSGFRPVFDVERARLRLGGRDGAADVYQQFEAVTLQKFVEAILPQKASWFGGGFAGDMWKSLLAQQMAEELARSGGIGIARAVRDAHPGLDEGVSARSESA
ncbi:MAG: rod-binding protein [Pseudochelatococcus sp.]|jgi:flagellar protein FlgJ|uniref:rod-binding protein n=1 Tax=Pseudochelatococcus sp. TaxID=2020869 RepID=UPI003D8F2C74